ncbi:GNAT family N-acetyltransferase [Okeania sp.]|uniref:GNAT family N-acetyltransferase n=1 Tax=Okeania sp. TaxID=3100323 RepID=UPI002B4B0F3A|nr:GNAT family N-acetyltransferase [Okeania sp.]MEB3341790.1 GNAT family N-acetyltransferase [Okeania sp.]
MLEIKLAQTSEEREKIFKLRYQIYVEEMGWWENCPNYEPNHEHKKLEDLLDFSANLFMALDNNELVGTIRCNYTKNLDPENLDLDYYTKLYQMEKAGDAYPLYTSITGRLMVQSNFRGKGIGLRIMEGLYKQQLLDEIKFDFIDAEAYLVPFFRKLSYQTIGKIDYQSNV